MCHAPTHINLRFCLLVCQFVVYAFNQPSFAPAHSHAMRTESYQRQSLILFIFLDSTFMKAHEVADDHECSRCIMCLCSDTTSAISGKKGGALVEFDRIDGKARLHLLCRHHAAELQLKRAYKVAFGTTKSPANADFKKFRQTL